MPSVKSLSLQGLVTAFTGPPQLPSLSQQIAALLWMVACLGTAFIQLIMIFQLQSMLSGNISSTVRKKKQETQISLGCSENKGFYLCLQVSEFLLYFKTFPSDIQNKTSTEGDAGEGPSAAQSLQKAEGIATLTPQCCWLAPRKFIVLLALLDARDYRNWSGELHEFKNQSILPEWQVFRLKRIYLCPFISSFRSIFPSLNSIHDKIIKKPNNQHVRHLLQSSIKKYRRR